MNKRLQMKFTTVANDTFSLSFPDFKENISTEELKEAAQAIIASNALSYKDSPAKVLAEATVITVSKQKLA